MSQYVNRWVGGTWNGDELKEEVLLQLSQPWGASNGQTSQRAVETTGSSHTRTHTRTQLKLG